MCPTFILISQVKGAIDAQAAQVKIYQEDVKKAKEASDKDATETAEYVLEWEKDDVVINAEQADEDAKLRLKSKSDGGCQ
jgi:hypothetical protein